MKIAVAESRVPLSDFDLNAYDKTKWRKCRFVWFGKCCGKPAAFERNTIFSKDLRYV